MKVLDFGLAKMIDGPAKAGYDVGGFDDGRSVRLQPDLTMSPTITTPAMTQLGMILGTAAYMAPEQARSKPVDKRSDIWAFGCVLFEMLTGRQAFDGEDVTDTIAAVVRTAMASRREGTLLRGSRAIAAADVSDDGEAFCVGPVRILFRGSASGGQRRRWDVAPDGKHFLLALENADDEIVPITLVVNWMAGLGK